jgi:hypothetical protein
MFRDDISSAPACEEACQGWPQSRDPGSTRLKRKANEDARLRHVTPRELYA